MYFASKRHGACGQTQKENMLLEATLFAVVLFNYSTSPLSTGRLHRKKKDSDKSQDGGQAVIAEGGGGVVAK